MLNHIFFSPNHGPVPSLLSDAPTLGPTTGRRRLRVLVVDDEPLIAHTVTAILNAHSFEAVDALSGEEALRIAPAFRPDVVLSDVLMPRMSGIDLGIRLRSEFPQARILLFSGQAATSDLMRKAEENGHHFELFPKPIHPEELIARLLGMI